MSTALQPVWLILILAITVEGLVEYGKNLYNFFSTKDKKTLLVQLGALVISCALLMLAKGRADLYAIVGVEFEAPFLGRLLTGIFASRGANHIFDLFKRLSSPSIAGILAEQAPPVINVNPGSLADTKVKIMAAPPHAYVPTGADFVQAAPQPAPVTVTVATGPAGAEDCQPPAP